MVFLPLSQYIFNYDIAKQAICIHYSFQYLHGKSNSNHYLYLLWSYTRLPCTLAKITNNRIHILYFPSPPTGWTNLPISDVHVGNLNWRSLNPVIISLCILYPHCNSFNWILKSLLKTCHETWFLEYFLKN